MASARGRIWGSLAAAALSAGVAWALGARMLAQAPAANAQASSEAKPSAHPKRRVEAADYLPGAALESEGASSKASLVIEADALADRSRGASEAALAAGALGLVAIEGSRWEPEGTFVASIARSTPLGRQRCEVEAAWMGGVDGAPGTPVVVSMLCGLPGAK